MTVLLEPTRTSETAQRGDERARGAHDAPGISPRGRAILHVLNEVFERLDDRDGNTSAALDAVREAAHA